MFLPSPVLVWVEALLPVALVGVQARGFLLCDGEAAGSGLLREGFIHIRHRLLEAGGVEALQDRRGRSKPKSEMSELEKLRAENRILRAEKERAEMEASFLKKLDEIERRRG